MHELVLIVFVHFDDYCLHWNQFRKQFQPYNCQKGFKKMGYLYYDFLRKQKLYLFILS